MLSPTLTSATATSSFFNAVGTAVGAVYETLTKAYSLLMLVGSDSPYSHRDTNVVRDMHKAPLLKSKVSLA